MTTTTTTTRSSASEHADEFVRMRRAGYTYYEIGDKFEISHERVRQVLVADGRAGEFTNEALRSERIALRDKVAEWLERHGPVARNRVIDQFKLTEAELNLLIGIGLPSYLIMTASRTVPPTFSFDDIQAALRKAWAELLLVNPDAVGLSHVMYERLRSASEPSAALLVGRYGWENICRKCDVPAGETWRSKASYASRWDDKRLMEAVALYTDVARTERVKPSYQGYDRWQQHDEDLPSGSLVRNRMRQLGLRTWPEIVETSLEAVRSGATV